MPLVTMFFCESRKFLQLHHVLVEAAHRDHRENARKELLEKVAFVVYIVEKEDLRIVVDGDRPHHLPEAELQVGRDVTDTQYDAYYEAERFERIGPNQRFDAAAERVEPYERHRGGDVPDESDAERFENQ